MQWNRGINYRYNGKHIPIYKCIKLTCCTPEIYSVIRQLYFNKKCPVYVSQFYFSNVKNKRANC